MGRGNSLFTTLPGDAVLCPLPLTLCCIVSPTSYVMLYCLPYILRYAVLSPLPLTLCCIVSPTSYVMLYCLPYLLQTPSGYVCPGRKDTKPLPTPSNYFRFTSEILDPTQNTIGFIKVSRSRGLLKGGFL